MATIPESPVYYSYKINYDNVKTLEDLITLLKLLNVGENSTNLTADARILEPFVEKGFIEIEVINTKGISKFKS